MLLEKVESILPTWMLGRMRRHFGGLMAGIAATMDALGEAVVRGRLAWLPGQLDVPGGNGFDNFDALPLIGRDRGIRSGLLESPFQYAADLRAWLEIWARASTPAMFLERLAAVLSPSPPRLRLVFSNGTITTWWTRETSGTLICHRSDGLGFSITIDSVVASVTSHATAFDWDSASVPPPTDQNDGGRWFVIVYAPCNLPYLSATDGVFGDPGLYGDAWNNPAVSNATFTPDEGTIGTTAPMKLVELLRATDQSFGSAGHRVAWWVIAFDAASYDPLGAAECNGTQGWHSSLDAGTNRRIPTRNPTAEYWRGRPGGGIGV